MTEGTPASESSADPASESPSSMSFDQAFNKAVADVEGAGAGAGSGAEGADGTSDTGSGDDADATTTDTTEDESAAGEGEGEQAAGDEQEGDQSHGTSDTTGQDESQESEESAEVKNLLAKLDPKLRKHWDRHFTQRSQDIAANRKFLQAFKTNPVEAAKAILASHEEEPDTSQLLPDANTIKTKLVENGFTEPQAKVVSDILEATVNSSKKVADQLAARDVASRVESEVDAFKKDYPDFDLIEKDMEKVMDKFQPSPGVPTREYLSLLRTVVLGDKAVAERVRKATEKMKTAAAASKTPKTSPVPTSQVKPGPSGKKRSFNESFEMALRGEIDGRGIRR